MRAALLLVLTACSATPTPTMATITRGMSVCWHPQREADTALADTLSQRLQNAGYVLVPSRCDIDLSWSLVIHSTSGSGRGGRGGRRFVTGARLVAERADGSEIDHWTFEDLDVWINDLDPVAIRFANALNASRKVAAVLYEPQPLERVGR